MLISLHRTYKGRPHKWWFQSVIVCLLVIFLGMFTYYFVSLYKQFQLLTGEHARLSPYIKISQKTESNDLMLSRLSRVNVAYEYLQYLNQFEQFEKKAKIAKWMRVYHSKQALYRQKNELEAALEIDLLVPVTASLKKRLSDYSQQWEQASLQEKKQMQLSFEQSLLTYEMVAKHHGYKILSTTWMREAVIHHWHEFMLNEANQQTDENLHAKLNSLVEFYFQLPNLENNWIKPDTALLQKTKNQLNITIDTDNFA